MRALATVAVALAAAGCAGPPALVGELALEDVAVRVEGEFFGTELGSIVGAPGDPDGDGRAELLLGIHHDRIEDWPHGLLLDWPLPEATTVTAQSTTISDFFVTPRGPLGDLDGDGTDEIAFGSRILYGPPPQQIDASTPTARIFEEASDTLGHILGAGDQNGDGLDDLWLVAPTARWPHDSDFGSGDRGAVYLLEGPIPDGVDLARADATVIGDEASTRLGQQAWAVDSDGDGALELAATLEWSVTILDGPWEGQRGLEAGSLLPEPEETCWGFHPAGGADLVGGPGQDLVLVDWYGADCADLLRVVEADGGASWTLLRGEEPLVGRPVVALPGDLDGDGHDDLVVADPDFGAIEDGGWGTPPGVGQVRIFYGPLSDGTTWDDADAVVGGQLPGDRAGATLTVVGDMTGDGRPELAVGAPRAARNPSGEAKGVVYVLRGARR